MSQTTDCRAGGQLLRKGNRPWFWVEIKCANLGRYDKKLSGCSSLARLCSLWLGLPWMCHQIVMPRLTNWTNYTNNQTDHFISCTMRAELDRLSLHCRLTHEEVFDLFDFSQQHKIENCQNWRLENCFMCCKILWTLLEQNYSQCRQQQGKQRGAVFRKTKLVSNWNKEGREGCILWCIHIQSAVHVQLWRGTNRECVVLVKFRMYITHSAATIRLRIKCYGEFYLAASS